MTRRTSAFPVSLIILIACMLLSGPLRAQTYTGIGGEAYTRSFSTLTPVERASVVQAQREGLAPLPRPTRRYGVYDSRVTTTQENEASPLDCAPEVSVPTRDDRSYIGTFSNKGKVRPLDPYRRLDEQTRLPHGKGKNSRPILEWPNARTMDFREPFINQVLELLNGHALLRQRVTSMFEAERWDLLLELSNELDRRTSEYKGDPHVKIHSNCIALVIRALAHYHLNKGSWHALLNDAAAMLNGFIQNDLNSTRDSATSPSTFALAGILVDLYYALSQKTNVEQWATFVFIAQDLPDPLYARVHSRAACILADYREYGKALVHLDYSDQFLPQERNKYLRRLIVDRIPQEELRKAPPYGQPGGERPDEDVKPPSDHKESSAQVRGNSSGWFLPGLNWIIRSN